MAVVDGSIPLSATIFLLTKFACWHTSLQLKSDLRVQNKKNTMERQINIYSNIYTYLQIFVPSYKSSVPSFKSFIPRYK